MKLVALIKPEKKFLKEIKYLKKIIFNKYGSQTYLDHPPHLTICVLNIKKNLLKQIKDSNLSIKKIKNIQFKLNLQKIHFFLNDPITKKTTFAIFIKKNKLLSNIQKKILQKFNKILIKDKKKLKNNIFNNNYKNYGYHFVNNQWKPHFTIVSIHKKKIKDEIFYNFLNNKKKVNENFKYIYFYEYKNSRHNFLWKSNITYEK